MTFFKHIQRPALLPFNLIYGLVVRTRNLFFNLKILRSVKFRIPVISVGNLTVGGTGKTPHVEYLTGLLLNDYRVAVLSRGYRRKTNHFVLAGRKSKVSDIGDELLQIKLKFPDVHVAADRNRIHGIKTLTESIRKLEVVILDDAFQHRYVKPGLSILLIDYNKPVFNDTLLPAGNLREPLRGMRRADIIVVTKCPSNLTPSDRGNFISRLYLITAQDIYFTRYEYGQPIRVFHSKHKKPEVLSYKQLRKPGISSMLVTGIANPESLRNFLSDIVPLADEISFPDHHSFDDNDMQLIGKRFNSIAAEEKYIFVTEKDAVRLRELEITDKNFRKVFYYIPVEVKFLAKGEKPFIKRIYKYLKKAKSAS